MAFPADPLDVRTELQIGGIWTDVSGDVLLRDLITISRGRSDEATRPDHCRATITFNNRNGRYSPRNAMSDLYGLIGRNTPVRVSVPAAARYLRLPGLSGARASTPDVAALDITGDLDVRVDATLLAWDTGNDYVDLIGKWAGAGAFSWRVSLDPEGRPYIAWSPDGTEASILANWPDDLLPVPSSGRISFRVTLDVNNGAGANVASFYYSLTPGTAGPWTAFGTFSIPGTTSVFASTAPLDVGDVRGTTAGLPPVGRIHAVEVRNGIDGPVVANPVFSTPAAGTSPYTDAAGRTWTTSGGAEISDRDYRLHAEVSNWPPKWDTSGNDRYVPVEAAGPLRRYGTGTNPLQSTLRRRIPSDPDVLAYVPCEDGTTATQAASGLPGGSPARLTGFTWAADDSLPGSAALPATGSAAMLSMPVPAPAGTPAGWHVECVYRVDTAPATSSEVLTIRLAGGLFASIRISLTGSSFTVTFVYADGVTADDTSTLPAPNSIGTWNRLVLYSRQLTATTMSFHFGVITIGGTAYGVDSATLTGKIGSVTALSATYGAAIEGLRIGHLAVFAAQETTIFNDADRGFNGEQAHARIERLCREQGMPVAFPAGTGPTTAMGPQRPAPLLDLLNECADADMGVLHEAREAAYLVYRRRTSMYNQPVRLALDYAVDGHIAPPLEPVDDDQAARNDITVSRVNGSSARVTQPDGPLSVQLPPDGIGPVPGGGTYNVQSDDQLPDMAGWQLHLGTQDASRYPSVHIDLSAAPGLIEAAKAVDVGDRMTIAHPPPECGGVGDVLDLLAEGYTETIGLYDWDITFNGAPGAPWTVGVVGDPVLGRADTDGSSLATGVTASGTTLSVASSPGPLWTADPAEAPWDIRVGGEIMRVEAVGATVLNVNPWMDFGIAGWAAMGTTATVAPVAMPRPDGITGPVLQITPNGTSASGGAIAVDRTAVGSITPGASYTVCMWAYSPGGHSDLRPAVDWYSSTATFLSSSLGSGFAVPAGQWVFLSQILVAPASASTAQVRARHGGTPAASAVWMAWGVRIMPVAGAQSSPQTMAVTRARNGISRAWNAGTGMRLAHPMTLAL
ncbi:hypothetical protein [Streptomyces sp. NRRL F-5123]|uniref:hypothetical protein n=1 Tax=Streptomyces sp. NRRL F-5123 TaxID=1463856 RepID=UPI0006940431|nr:hypothetical protein [Streptomyces sp. NRRL F-5123]